MLLFGLIVCSIILLLTLHDHYMPETLHWLSQDSFSKSWNFT